jgi:hypothetical protein
MNAQDQHSNQGGGTVLSAVAKVTSGELTSLTPDEVQLLAEGAGELLPDLDLPPLTDEEAQAVVDVLVEFELDSMEDVGEFIEQVLEGEVEIDPETIAALAGLACI